MITIFTTLVTILEIPVILDIALCVLIFVVAIPILLDMVFEESHICQSILEKCESILKKYSWYNKAVDYKEKHGIFVVLMIFLICLLIIYPSCFSCGYNKDFIAANYSNIQFEKINGHMNPYSISSSIETQIINNDSLFVVKINDSDSIIFNRRTLKLEKRAEIEQSTEDYSRYENCNMFSKMVLGAFVIPSWKEIKGNYYFSFNGKKWWIICCMVAGYFGYNQGVKCRLTEALNKDWKHWTKVQSQLNDEKWWLKLSEKYPFYQEVDKKGYIIDEDFAYSSGIGIEYQIQNDTIVITDVNKDYPAEKAGIVKGDKIISIDGKISIGKDVDGIYVFISLRGEKGSKVNLGIQRDGESEIKFFEIERVPLPISIGLRYFIEAPKISF